MNAVPGLISLEALARAPGDGCTIGITTSVDSVRAWVDMANKTPVSMASYNLPRRRRTPALGLLAQGGGVGRLPLLNERPRHIGWGHVV